MEDWNWWEFALGVALGAINYGFGYLNGKYDERKRQARRPL